MLALAGCVGGDDDSGSIACAADGTCPTGLACARQTGLCVGAGVAGDAGAPSGARDCRFEESACGPDFECVEVAGQWTCSPEPEPSSGKVSNEDASIFIPRDPDATVPPPDACGPWTTPVLLAFSLALDPSRPILFEAEFEAGDFPDGSIIRLTATPLRVWCDEGPCEPDDPRWRERLLPSFEAQSAESSDEGPLALDLQTVRLPGEANPISGSDITAEVILYVDLETDGSICGELSGRLIQPFEFLLQRESNVFGTASVCGLETIETLIPQARCP